MQTTEGTLLGGRVRYTQPAQGYRTGIEPVLLAASIPAAPGQTVLEAGCGAGAGLLCLAHRVPGLIGFGIERDPATAALARDNLAANGAPYTVLTADITALPASPPSALPAIDHAFANPPWHDPAGTPPPDARRAAATHRDAGGLAPWIEALAAALRPGGTLTLALPASLAAEAITLLHQARLPQQTLIPLWPRQGQPAKLILLRAASTRGPTRIGPGLTLHDGPGYTREAERILREAQVLLG